MTFKVFVAREPGPDYKSYSIMKALGTRYSHAGVVVDDFIFHATREGVHATHVPEFLSDHVFTHLIDVTDYVIDEDYALGWCRGNIGKDYSESQLVAMFVKPLRILGFFNDNKSEMICSEFAARFIDECTTIKVFRGVDLDFVDPKRFIETMLRFEKQTKRKGV